MTKLMSEILKDPDAVFQFEADLPSGNRMIGTCGPLIGDRLHAAITFSRSPASEQDVALAQRVFNLAIGKLPEIAQVSNSPEQREEALKTMRKFMGGGQG